MRSNFRVSFTRHLPATMPTGIHREVSVDLFTDFGDPVLEDREAEDDFLLDIAIYGGSDFRYNFDDLNCSSKQPQDSGDETHNFEAFKDSSAASAVSFRGLRISRSKGWKLWIRHSAPLNAQTCKSFRMHARCTYRGESRHSGGGHILSCWSPVFDIVGDSVPTVLSEDAAASRRLSADAYPMRCIRSRIRAASSQDPGFSARSTLQTRSP